MALTVLSQPRFLPTPILRWKIRKECTALSSKYSPPCKYIPHYMRGEGVQYFTIGNVRNLVVKIFPTKRALISGLGGGRTRE